MTRDSGVSTQLEFNNHNVPRRRYKEKHSISPLWKQKKQVQVTSLEQTAFNLFKLPGKKYSSSRAANLDGNGGGKKGYNLFTGQRT